MSIMQKFLKNIGVYFCEHRKIVHETVISFVSCIEEPTEVILSKKL